MENISFKKKLPWVFPLYVYGSFVAVHLSMEHYANRPCEQFGYKHRYESASVVAHTNLCYTFNGGIG